MTPPLIDRAVLDELSRIIGAQGTRTVLAIFVVECRGYLETIAEAGAQPADPGRRERALRAAHSLKSCAGQVGPLRCPPPPPRSNSPPATPRAISQKPPPPSTNAPRIRCQRWRRFKAAEATRPSRPPPPQAG